MSTTIDKAARAFYESFYDGNPGRAWEDLPPSVVLRYHEDMRAAFAAVRELSPELLSNNEWDYGPEVWRETFDFILAEEAA